MLRVRKKKFFLFVVNVWPDLLFFGPGRSENSPTANNVTLVCWPELKMKSKTTT